MYLKKQTVHKQKSTLVRICTFHSRVDGGIHNATLLPIVTSVVRHEASEFCNSPVVPKSHEDCFSKGARGLTVMLL